MPDPSNALKSFQEVLDKGITVHLCTHNRDYCLLFDQPDNQTRYSYAKVVNGEVQALSMFVVAEPLDGKLCFNIGYAVKPTFRGRQLGVEAVRLGVEELKTGLGRNQVSSFYLEAVVEVGNQPSVGVARAVFGSTGKAITDSFSKLPALYFKTSITIP
jgi:hypothetical protein